MQKPLNITRRLTAAFGLLAVVLLVVGWQGLSHLRQLNVEMQKIVHEQWAEERLAHEALHLSDTNSRLTLLIFLLDDQDEIQRLLAERTANTARISGLMSEIEPHVGQGKEAELFAAVNATRTPYVESYKEALALLTQHKSDEARKMMVDVVRPNLTAYHDAWTAFDKFQVDEADQVVRQSNADYATGQEDFVLLLLLAGTLGSAIAIFTVLRMGREIIVRQRAEESLQRAHDQLEQRVLERTADLKKTNEALQVEMTERRQAEETLRKSEEKFRQMAENTTDLFWMTSPDLQKVLYASPAYKLIFGRSLESLYAHPQQWAEAILPEERERVFALFSSLGTGAPSVSDEFQITRPDGAVRWIHSRGFPVRDAAGNVIRLTGIATDITERRRDEETLRLLNSAMIQSKEAITITDAKLELPGPEIMFVNPAFTNMTGYTAEEAIGKTPRILQGPRTDKTVLRRLRQNLEHGEVFQGEAINYRKDGTEFTLEWQVAPIRNESGKTTHFVAIQRDITERKKNEQKLNVQYAISSVLAGSSTMEQADSRILRTLCENLGWDAGGLWIVDPKEGVLRYAEMWSAPNLQIEEFKTASRQITFARGIGLPGRIWSSGQPAWIPDVVQDANFPRSPIAAKADLHGAFGFPVLIGNEVGAVVELFSHETRMPDDSLLLIVAAIGNQIGQFFQRKRLEDQLFQSQKMETIGKLAGGVAHEFNSILTAIIGQSELLLNDLPVGNPLVKNATEIRQAADRAATLTRQLLAYGRKQILQPEILDLNQLLGDMTGTLRHLMGSQVDVQIIPDGGLKMVKIDPGQMEQVLVNIAMNAADAMPNGGKFTLETANVTLSEEFVRPFPGLKPGDYVTLAMTDTGTGMSEEVKARAFDPFFSTKGVGEGTGLGLATCYGILKQSNGHMSLYSEEARGTTFKIYLPQVDQPTTIPLSQAKVIDSPRGTETILLAEDDPFLLKMSAAYLEQKGYTVITAANGIEALKLKNKPGMGHIDLLLTDVVMPHMSGKELADRIRATYPHTKILYTSAYTENAIVHQGVLNDGVKFLQKPFTPTALAKKVREVLDQSPS